MPHYLHLIGQLNRFAFFLLPLCFFSCKNEATVNDNHLLSSNAGFELLPASATNVHFSNNITESFQDNILINSYLYNGGGVAIIDVNNDGWQDLYFTSTQESNRLYLNKGSFFFEDITEKAGVGAKPGVKTGVTVVDINADGWQDLYVCRSGMLPSPERANLLFINNGDLTFTESAAEYGLDDRSASNHANFFDYDLDGDLDVYVLNHPVAFKEVNNISARQEGDQYIRNKEARDEWESDKLFRNEGNGKFTNVTHKAGINNRAWGLSVTVSDFNNDRFPDIFVGNDYIEPDILYINNRNGTFSIQTDAYFRHTSNHTMGVDIADFNNDGLVDVVALDMIAEDNQRQKELVTTMILERYNTLLKFGYGHQMMRNVLQLNTGCQPSQAPPFSEIGELTGIANTDWSWSPLLMDFDNDGFKDLYITNGYRRDISNLDYLIYTVDSVMKRGGLNQQNFPTIYDYLNLIPATPLRNYMFKNEDGLKFKNVSKEWGMEHSGYSNGSAYADLDNDGDMDLVVNNIHGKAMIYKNNSSEKPGANWLQVQLKGVPENPAGTGSRIQITYGGGKIQYQELSPVRGFFSSSQHIFHFGLGGTKSLSKIQLQWPDGQMQVLENIPANHRLTLDYKQAQGGKWQQAEYPKPLFSEAKNTGIDFLHTEDGFLDFNRERLLPHKFSDLGPNIAVADVNGDGLDDFYIGGAANEPGALFVQQGNSTFKNASMAVWVADAVYEDLGCTFFDADNDNDLDLYVVSGGSTFNDGSELYQDRLYLNDGKGSFKKSINALPKITGSGSCVVAFDFDKDKDQDLFIGGLVRPGLYPMPPNTLVLQNRGGIFKDVTPQAAPELSQIGLVRDFVWADVDGDNYEELIVAGEWLPVSIFKLKNGILKNVTGQFDLSNSRGWWNCVQAEDMDGDGDIDLIAGNLGLNSRLRASPNKPMIIFVKDFDGNGSIDPIMTYYNQDKIYPLPQRDMLIKQIPALKKKFVKFKDYGLATIEDVFTESELKDALKLQANTFASTYFENRNGKYIAHTLPMEAQYAPCNQILVTDIDKDGKKDLILAGNSYSPEVETGRYDAGNGSILFGKGNSQFETLANLQAGFWASKNVRDMAIIKLANGNKLILVANNNDRLQGFVYQ